MSVNQGFSNIKSIKIVSIHEFYFVLDSKNWQLYNGYGDFLLVGSLDFGNRYVVIKYLGKEIILLPRNRLWTLDVVFCQIEIVLKDSTAFFILMNCLDVCV